MRRKVDSTDPVVVCGAGAAGISTALSAAQHGCDVWLIESRNEIGGTVTHSLIHTLGGLFDSDGTLLNGGLCEELIGRLKLADPRTCLRQIGHVWVLQVAPDVYGAVVREWIGEYSNLRVACASRVVDVVTRNHAVEQLTVQTPDGEFIQHPSNVVDATGTAEIVRLIDAQLVEDDPERAAGGLIFTLQGVSPDALTYPKNLGLVRAIHTAASDGALPDTCQKAWIDKGVADDEVYIKLFVPLSGIRGQDSDDFAGAARTQAAVASFVHTFPGFANASVDIIGEIGIRDGGRVRGEYTLTADDVRCGKHFDDATCRCAWPIEYWHPIDGLFLEYLDHGVHYEIPMRALQLAGHSNVWIAGKCLSADRLAQSSARVVGTCWGMGSAVGRAVAERREAIAV